MNNNRAERRISARERATATILGHPDLSVTCRIKNFSRSGMCITVDQDIESGKIVRVEWDNHFLVGRVRRVSTVKDGRQVGLQLLYCSKWSDDIASLLEQGSSGGKASLPAWLTAWFSGASRQRTAI